MTYIEKYPTKDGGHYCLIVSEKEMDKFSSLEEMKNSSLYKARLRNVERLVNVFP